MIDSKIRAAILILRAVSTEKKTVEQLAKETGVSFPYLQQISRKLGRAGLVGVQRGPGGGTYSKRDKVSFAEVYKVFKEPKTAYSMPDVEEKVFAVMDLVVVA
jgi:DNA-binding IscR family transcriptional regulator